jgi:oligoendopeptidase F
MHLSVALLLASSIAFNLASADAIDDTWNLADLYPSVEAWNADAAKLEAQIKDLDACKGHLADNAGTFKKCLDLRTDMQKRFLRMAVYSSQQYSGDTGAPANLELSQRTDVIEAKVDEAGSFMNPEILRVGKQKVAGFVARDKALAMYRHPLDEILRRAPHTLNGEGEALIAQFGLMSDAGSSAYSILTNADIPWPTVKLSTGEQVVLDASAYTKYRAEPNRDDRKLVMDAFFATFKTYERTLGVTLYSQLKQNSVFAKVLKYPDSITRALDARNVPVAVIDTLIAQTNASLPTLYRYFRLRARMLGVSQMRYYDIYPPLVHSDIKFPLATAKDLVLEAVAPLGPEYVATMDRGFGSRWMDAYPRKNKQSGAHMAGIAYDVHPYVLMNYNDDYASVTTVAHEWGHAMHSYLANHTQPFATAGYAIFVGEIASTFNEEMLLKRVLKTAKSDDERLFYLGSALEQLRGTFFRQAMFAEFERTIHARVDKGEPLAGDGMTRIYCDILKRYHGAAEGVVAIDDNYCVEWEYIPHFYNPFYVYQYATSIAASSLFAQKVTRGEPGALERYLALLRSGGSDYPYELVKKAGVDLASPAPYQALVAHMNEIMDEIEAILANRKQPAS